MPRLHAMDSDRESGREKRAGRERCARPRASRWAWVRRRIRDEAGASAVEFALFAPMLIFSLVAAIDLGLAEYERMTIDHALRSAAQSAMADQGQDAVLKALQSTASKNFTLSDGTTANADALKVSVRRFCACPEATGTEVSCSSTCAGSAPTFIYYRVTGTKVHRTAMLPHIELSPSVQVQVR